MRDSDRQAELDKAVLMLPTIQAEFVQRRAQVCDWVSAIGFPTSSLGTYGGGGDEDGRTPVQAIALATRGDEFGHRLATADDALDALVAALAVLDTFIAWSKPVGKLPDESKVPPICEDCAEPIEGKVRNGRCDRCRKHFERHGMTWPKRHVDPKTAQDMTPPPAKSKAKMGDGWVYGNSGTVGQAS